MQDRTEYIDDYLNNRLSEKERLEFEQELQSNEALSKELKLQKRLGALLEASERIDLRDRVAEVNNSIKPKRKYLLLKVAAILIVALLSSYYFIHSRYTDSALALNYDTVYPDLVTTMGTEDQAVQQVMDLYNTGDFEECAGALKELRLDRGVDGLEIYEVVSLRKSQKIEEAIQLAIRMINQQNEQEAAFEWQLVLCYLSGENGEKAKQQLDHFLQQNYAYKTDEATALNEDLSAFWR